jgi:nitrite reductase (NADH) large subunit
MTDTTWRCTVCGSPYTGEGCPATCPVCGAGADHFASRAARRSGRPVKRPPLVIVGAGIAGLSAAEAARKASPRLDIVLIERENELPYYRLNLTRYLAGEITAEQLRIHPAAWFRDKHIDLRLETDVANIDAARKTLRLGDGSELVYDRLILAPGAHPFIPPVAGIDKAGVGALRTKRNADDILNDLRPGLPCTVIGGGVLGLEAAAALARQGAKPTLIEGFDWLLPLQLNPAGGAWLARHVESLGIRLICGGRVRRLAGDDRVTGVMLEGGETVPAKRVVFAAGVRCNNELAHRAGLEVKRGILVDSRLRTSQRDIFAIGDVAEHQGVLYGTWAPSMTQGRIAGTIAAGGEALFTGMARSHILKVLDVGLFSIGQVRPEDGSYQVFEENRPDRYALFVFRNDLLSGAILLGDTSLARHLRKWIEEQRDCAELLAGAKDGGTLRERFEAAGS